MADNTSYLCQDMCDQLHWSWPIADWQTGTNVPWHTDTSILWHINTLALAHYYYGTLAHSFFCTCHCRPHCPGHPHCGRVGGSWVEWSSPTDCQLNPTDCQGTRTDTLHCWTRAQTDTEWLVVRYLYIVTAHRWTLDWGHWLARDTEDWTLDLLSFVLHRLESGTVLLWGRSHLSVPEYIPPPPLELSRVLVGSWQLSDNRRIVKPLSSGRLRGAAAFSASSWHFVISSIFLLFHLRISSVSQRDCSKSLDIHWEGDASHCLL